MSYTRTKGQITKLQQVVESTQDYHYMYFSDDHSLRLAALHGQYIYHLHKDLSGLSTEHALEQFLGAKYRVVDEYAKDCIQIAYSAADLYGMKVKGWTDSALKAFDWFLITLINDLLEEKISKPRGRTYETDVYQHLINKKGDYEIIGTAFKSIYEQNNQFKHVQVEESDGVRVPRRWSNKKYRKAKELILEQFKKALVTFEKELRNSDLESGD